MPIKIPDNLPTASVLKKENIFVMNEDRAEHQDIRPLEIVIMNLMPNKIVTETQLLRLLGNSPLQVNITLLHPRTHKSQNTPEEHLLNFYSVFDEIKNNKYDGMVITGAPLEEIAFLEVDFWPELAEIMDWSTKNVHSTFHICWAAQAGLYYHYKVPKHKLDSKLFGVFPHRACVSNVPLLRGFDDVFFAPHSRHTTNRKEDILRVPQLEILAESEEAGVYIAAAKGGRQIFVSGHSEYDFYSLKDEYERDVAQGLNIALPVNYFPEDDPQNQPRVNWRGHANLLFSNWLNYYVYQETPYNRAEIKEA